MVDEELNLKSIKKLRTVRNGPGVLPVVLALMSQQACLAANIRNRVLNLGRGVVCRGKQPELCWMLALVLVNLEQHCNAQASRAADADGQPHRDDGGQSGGQRFLFHACRLVGYCLRSDTLSTHARLHNNTRLHSKRT